MSPPDFLTYTDLARIFALSGSTIRRRLPEWQARGFPAPLHFSKKHKRWNPRFVLAWKAREENRLAGNFVPPPHLSIVPHTG
jgi:hypothetical protein